MIFTDFQKKIAKFIVEDKPKETDYIFQYLFEKILKKFFKEMGVKITELSIELEVNNKINTEDYLKAKKNFYELVLLIDFLIDKEHIIFMIDDSVLRSFNFSNSLEMKKSITIPFLKEKRIKLLNSMNYDFVITHTLRDFVSGNYCTTEQKNLKYTIYALAFSVLFSAANLFAQIYLSTKESDIKVRFDNSHELQKNINVGIYIVDYNPLKFEYFTLPKNH